jgi:hypothetical protein
MISSSRESQGLKNRSKIEETGPGPVSLVFNKPVSESVFN